MRRAIGPEPVRKAFAFDLDGTITPAGLVPSRRARDTIQAARRMGLAAVLVSGREAASLARFSSALGPLDGVVAENGAVLEIPGGAPTVLGRAVGLQVRARLSARPALDAAFGEVVASASWSDRSRVARQLSGLDVHVTRNRDRLMVLPAGITKRTGLASVLRRLGISPDRFAAIGDGENDLPMLRGAAISGAVANAVPIVRSTAAFVARSPFERGVAEFLHGPVAAWILPSSPPRPG